MPAEDLLSLDRALEPEIREGGLDYRRQQGNETISAGALQRIGMGLRAIELQCGPTRQSPPTLYEGADPEQHSPHVGVLDDRYRASASRPGFAFASQSTTVSVFSTSDMLSSYEKERGRGQRGPPCSSANEPLEPVEHRFGIGGQVVVAVEAPVRAVDPDQILLVGRHGIEHRLHVGGRRQRIVADLQE